MRKREKFSKDSPIKIIQATPGINWIIPLTILVKSQREALLRPLLDQTDDPHLKKAIAVFIKYGRVELIKMANGPSNFRRLFVWDWYTNYMGSKFNCKLPNKKPRVKLIT